MSITNLRSVPTPTTALDDWKVWQHAQRLSHRTISERIRVISQLHNESGVQPVNAQAIDIVEWMAEHDEWSDSTAVTYASYLNAWFRWLQITDRRSDDPMVKVGTPRTPDREPRPIADSDVPKLLNARMWTKTRYMILLALLAGLRVHEIAKIRGEDFDHAAGLIWVRGKGRSVRSVPMHPVLREVASLMPETGWWFPMRGYPGEHTLSKSVSDIVGRTMRRAGVKGTPHALRHWYGSALHDDGHDIRVVQELMRHKSIASTQIYTKVSDQRRRDAIVGLDLMRGLRDVA
ncbi:tyrosine-type recombinase/integrase [Gordonia sp. OPL2]|uniref:tyrosine-type recombinase/integrase n=1 Tax=Gordonia sp. OPL2 TaxID=2486274 RepID=UPI0021CCDA97|nr:tyrosine-type recombinase/integrase [Gordonia sp. OPL2]